jgi:hypothetical protein
MYYAGNVALSVQMKTARNSSVAAPKLIDSTTRVAAVEGDWKQAELELPANTDYQASDSNRHVSLAPEVRMRRWFQCASVVDTCAGDAYRRLPSVVSSNKMSLACITVRGSV